MSCKNCKSIKLKKILNIGSQPLSGFFYQSKKTKLRKYSLNLFKCSTCDLVQIKNKIDVRKMYGEHYGYETSVSKMMMSHLLEKKKRLIKNGFLKKKYNILDIGSNDGSFLNILGKNYNLVGIDPSAKKFIKNYKNIKLIDNFFSKKNVFTKIKNLKRFDLISSFAVFYDVDDPNSFCRDVHDLLDDKGVWICEFSYLPLMLKNLTFDQICHEHILYYDFTVFENIIKKNNLKVLDIKLNEINGGSIEVIISKKNANFKVNSKMINKIKNDEKKITFNAFNNFSKRIFKVKKDLINFLSKNKPILGYGASTKGNIVLNLCNLNSKSIKYICDANLKKINKFTPGSNIKIISKKLMRRMQPKYLLVLIWSFRSEVIKEEINYLKNGGNLVFHLPKFHIVNYKNYKNYLKKSFKQFSYSY